jgi:hypothetical protein
MFHLFVMLVNCAHMYALANVLVRGLVKKWNAYLYLINITTSQVTAPARLLARMAASQ